MSSRRLRRVSLSGDMSGQYVVVEERAHGFLLLAPDLSRNAEGASEPAGLDAGAMPVLARLFSRSRRQEPKDITGLLAGWGAQLGEDEVLGEFLAADVDGRPGFLVITNQRLIFFAHTVGRSRPPEEHLLVDARNVALVRRGARRELRVAWRGSDSVISGLSRGSLERLQQRLAARHIS